MVNYSVLIPYFDRPRLFAKSVRSIPDRDDIQVIVINNNTEPLPESCRFSTKHSSVLFLDHPKGGPGGAINAGLPYAEGKYILFLDSDDFFTDNAFESFDRYLEDGADLIFFKVCSLDLSSGKESFRHKSYDNLISRYFKDGGEDGLRYHWGSRCGKMYLSSMIKKNGITNGEGAGGDVLFSARAGYYAGSVRVSGESVYTICSGGAEPSFTRRFTSDDWLNKYRMYCEKYLFLLARGRGDIVDPLYRFAFKALLRNGWKEFKKYRSIADTSGISYSRLAAKYFINKTGLTRIRDAVRPLLHKFNRIYLECHLADHCNLNCAGCSHFSPLSGEKLCDYCSFERDLKRMKELFPGKVRRIRLLGGEPLLHPDALQFVRCAHDLFPDAKRVFVTNALLLSRQSEEFFTTIRDTRTEIYISRYPIELDYDKLADELASRGISYHLEALSSSFRKDAVIEDGIRNKLLAWLGCALAVRCSQLRDGRIYMCCKPAYIHYFNERFGKSIEVTDSDYMDIYRKDARKEILRYLRHPIPFCSYCRTGESSFFWHKSERTSDEWQ